MEPAEARDLFPVTRDQLYLNHAACSPYSVRVQRALRQYLESRASGRVDNFKRDKQEMERLRTNLAALLQSPPDRLAITSNTSHGLNIVAQGLSWQSGDEILLSTMEFPANVYPFLNLKKQGVIVKWFSPKDGRILVEHIAEHVTKKTRLLAISYVQYLNGFRADLQAIGAWCRERGILCVVDGIQGVGAMPLLIKDLPIDAVAAGGHKWLMAPKGIGLLYLTEELQRQLELRYLGWLSVVEPFQFHQFDQPLQPDAARFEIATPNHLGIYGMNAAVQLINEVGIQTIAEQILDITGYLISRLQEVGCEVLTPLDASERAGIVLFSCGNMDENQRIYQALLERKMTLSSREGMLRVSPHFYNTREDMDKFLQVLQEIL